MTTGELIKVRHKGSSGLGPAFTWQADDTLAQRLPPLAIPAMGEDARAEFRLILALEHPYTNAHLGDCLALAEARGFVTDPRDWVPDFKNPGGHSPLYQPWVDWLTEHGFTKIHAGNTLTAANWSQWTPAAFGNAFTALARTDLPAASALVFEHSAAMPAAFRSAIVATLTAAGSFNGSYPWQVPLIRHFLTDKTPKVRDMARALLDKLDGFETEESHAAELARHLSVENGRVSYRERSNPNHSPFWRHWHSTTFAALADALGLTPAQLAHGAELDFLDRQFRMLAAGTGDAEVRSILVRRLLATKGGEEIAMGQFRGVERGLWERGLEAYFRSPYWNSVQDYLGPERGHLTPEQMHRMSAFESIRDWLAQHLKKKIKPVNNQYDPLRAVALSVGKEAAQEALDLALAAGMKPDNPRLTMLRFNLAL